MKMIDVTIENERVKVKKNESLDILAKDYKDRFDTPIVLANVNNQIVELHREVNEEDEISFLDISTESGHRAYQRTLSFLMIYAAKEVLGKDTRVIIEHSINRNWYCEIVSRDKKRTVQDIDKETLEKMKVIMNKVIHDEVYLNRKSVNREVGIRLAKDMGLEDKVDNLRFISSTSVTFYKLDWFYDYFYGPMIIETEKLLPFDLILQDRGFLLQFTSRQNPNELYEQEINQSLTKIFHESSEWAKILEADTVGALNHIAVKGEMDEFIRISEALHEKRVSQIADMIVESNKPLVLIAGPSSSGKTTFAQRLSIQLRVNGRRSHIVSVDNYFNDSDTVPLDKEGNPDFEALEHVNLQLLNDDLQKLLKYEAVTLPSYNFTKGIREENGEWMQLRKGDILIVEGIHALNDDMTYSINKDMKYKVFISALTQLNLDDHNRISATDNRLLRRIVRDHKYRAYSAARTIEVWANVQKGEQKHIFPYQEEADIFINSALLYEIGILKTHAAPLLFAIEPHEKEYLEARRLLRFLDSFMSISSEAVPNTSILREFIGGSSFRT